MMNTQEKQQFLEHWKTTRQKGILRYVLMTALSWGTFTVLFFRLIQVFVSEMINMDAFVNAFASREFLIYWGVFLLGGLFYGLTMWFYFNWQYRKWADEINGRIGE